MSSNYRSGRSVDIAGERVVLTAEGTLSGYLEAGVSKDGEPLVRYAGTQKWYLIEQTQENNKAFKTPEEIVSLIEESEGTTDVAGNTQPFRI